MKKFIISLIFSKILISCSNNNIFFQNTWTKNDKNFDFVINQISNNVEKIWGINEVLISGPKDYVKYDNKYHTRSRINFEKGKITIESINRNNILESLHKEIISILLINSHPNYNNFFNIKNNSLKKELLLSNQILDNYNKPINSTKNASDFANYLIQNHLKYRLSKKKVIWFIVIPMEKNHLKKRINQYLSIIYKAAQKYNVEKSLILAIIHIESNFNPYAESNSDALGLMQIVQNSAGLDVFRLKKKWGKPTRKYLFDPEKNIDTGTAYLSILESNYLSGIIDPTSRRYAVIIAYNSGIKNIFRIFSHDKNIALKKINSISSKKFYQILIKKHPSLEARKYLQKVYNAQKKYSKIFI